MGNAPTLPWALNGLYCQKVLLIVKPARFILMSNLLLKARHSFIVVTKDDLNHPF